MDQEKQNHIETAKRVWEHYLNGMSKNQIAKTLQINRAEVIHIIKYTTQTLYIDTESLREELNKISAENRILLQKIEELKNFVYSDKDAYRNGAKTGRKLSYKRLYEIYLSRWGKAQAALEKCHSTKSSLSDKKLI